MAQIKKKVADLGQKGKERNEAIDELAKFMKNNVKPLLNKSDSKIEEALRDVEAPAGKGLKHVLEFIADRVSFIANSSR